MRQSVARAGSILLWLILISIAPAVRAQTHPSIEIPLERCDRLPIVKLKIGGAEARFLVDTAATSMLNIKSISSGQSKKVQITSWTGTAVTNAREVFVRELSLGNHTVYDLTLEAVDLTAIAHACDGQIDGILGVDLLEKLGVTIDLQRSVARMEPRHAFPEASVISDMESAMQSCWKAFNNAETDRLEQCFDRDFVMTGPTAEYRGREQVGQYLRERYFQGGPRARLEMKMSDQRAVGNVVWTLYDFSVESEAVHEAGRGMMICRKSGDRWYILSMHDAPAASEAPK